MKVGDTVISIVPLLSHQGRTIPSHHPLKVVTTNKPHKHTWFPVTAVEFLGTHGVLLTANCETRVLRHV